MNFKDIYTKTIISESGYGHKREDVEFRYFKIAIHSIIVLLLLWIFFWGFYTVQPWEVAFTKTFGKINEEVKSPWLYFKLPFVTQAVKVNTRNIVVTTSETAASKDAQDVTTELAVNFSIKPDSSITLYETVGRENVIKDQIVNKAVQESIKAATAKFTATESITRRQEVRDVMIKNLEEKLTPRGLVINQVDILNFSFSAQFNKAIEAKVTAEQNALKAEKDLERVKFEAQQKIERAKAEAEQIRIQAEAITKQGGKEYVQLQWINAWKSGGAKVPTTILSEGSEYILNLK